MMLLVGVVDRFWPAQVAAELMTGDVNIAVAQFTAPASGDRTEVTDTSGALATSVHEFLDSELDGMAPYDIDVRSPRDTGVVDGVTAEQRATEADRLAERIQADIVIFGVLTVAEGSTSLSPEFFITDHRLVSNAEELVGHYRLGLDVSVPASIEGNAQARSDLRTELLERADGLVHFILGLSSFSLGDYQSAYDTLLTIEEEGLFRQDSGKEILHLFLGHAAGRLHDYDLAEEQYAAAMAVSPSYARALIGLAALHFQRAHNGCTATATDVAGMQRAVDYYRQARASPNQPALADIDVKSAFGLGRAHLCLSQAGVADEWDEAGNELRVVIEVHNQGNERVAPLAAEAWSTLGLVQMGTAAAEPDQLEEAARSFQRAIDISTVPDRRSLWYGFLGDVYCRLQRPADAAAAYDAALASAPDEQARDRLLSSRRAGC